MEGIWPFRLSRRANATAVPMDRDFAPLFNFLGQRPQVFDGSVAVPAPAKPAPSPAVAPASPKAGVVPAKAPAVEAASGLLRQLRFARGALSHARRRLARAAVTPRERST